MKFLTQNSNQKNQSRLVYLSAQRDGESRSGLDLINLDGLDAPIDETPLSRMVEDTASRFRVETMQTVAANDNTLGERAGELALRSQREEGGTLNLRGVFNMVAPTEDWYLPTAAGLDSLNPKKWLVGVLNSKGPMISAFRDNLDSIVNINADSPLIHSTLSHTFSKNNLGDALTAISDGKRSGASLASLNILEKGLDSFFPGSTKDFDDFEQEMVQVFEKSEPWKKTLRKWVYINYEGRIKKQAKALRTQMERGYEQLKANIKSAEEQQSRRVENMNAKMLRYANSLQEKGDIDSLENMWRMITDIIQNPDEFIAKRNPNYYGINWREEFGCGKGETGAINFLDTLAKFQTENVLDLPAIQLAHHNNMRVVGMVKEQNEAVQTNAKSFELKKLQQLIDSTEVEMAGVSDKELSTSFMVQTLIDALHRPPLNINTEAEVFNDSSGIYQSPAVKLGQLVAYLLKNPSLITSDGVDGRLNIEAVAVLKKYLYQKESNLLEQLEAKAFGEQPTPAVRAQMLISAENVFNEAKSVLTDAIPSLPEAMRSEDGTKVDDALNKLDSLVVSYDTLTKRLGLDAEGGIVADSFLAKLSAVSEPEQKTFQNLSELREIVEILRKANAPLKQERQDLIEKYGTQEGSFIKTQEDALAEYRQSLKKVVEETGGGVGTTGGKNIMDFEGMGGGAEGGEGGSVGGIRTSVDVMQDQMSDLLKILQEASQKIMQRNGLPFSIPDSTANVDLPFIELALESFSDRKTELGLNDELEAKLKGKRLGVDDLMQLEIANESNAHLRDLSTQLLQNFTSQQWTRLVTKPIGFKLESIEFGDTTNQTELNPVATVLNSQSISNIRFLPTPQGEKFSGSMIYAENDDYFIKMVSPRVTAQGDPANVFLYKKGDKGDLLTPFQALPDAKGVMITASVKNDTLRSNDYYQPLFKEKALT